MLLVAPLGNAQGNTPNAGGRPPDPSGSSGPGRPFLAIWFRCCHIYGRIYRNPERTAYSGRCPRCGAPVRALIGPDGTSQRILRAE